MSKIRPVHKEITASKDLPELRDSILKRMQLLDGRVVRSEDNTLECDFGSLLQSRIIGEFWVSKSTLPKNALIKMQAASGGGTLVSLDIKDTHKYGFKWGFIQKYEQALEELSESLLSAIK